MGQKEEVVEKFDHLKSMKYSHATTKAFTEKGLYMLATILKSPLATEVTIAIIETFTKLREVSRAIARVNEDAEKGITPKEQEQGKIQGLMSEVLADNLPLKMRKMAFSLKPKREKTQSANATGQRIPCSDMIFLRMDTFTVEKSDLS